MPWIQVQKGGEEIQSNGRCQRHSESCKNVVPNSQGFFRVCELPYDNVDCREGGVYHDNTVDDHA